MESLPKVKYKLRNSCTKESQKEWGNNCKRSPLRNNLSQVPVKCNPRVSSIRQSQRAQRKACNFRTILTRFLSGLKSKTLPWAKNEEMAVTQINDISHCYDLLNILLFKGKNLKTIKYNQALLEPSVHNITTLFYQTFEF